MNDDPASADDDPSPVGPSEEVRTAAQLAAALPAALRRPAFEALLRENKPAPIESPIPFVAAFIVLGFVAGLFAGLSESPVGATVVAGLLALVGAGGLVASLVVRDKALRFAASAPAYAVCGLCLASVAGAFLGISLREGLWSKPEAQVLPVDVHTAFPALAPTQKLRLQLFQLALARAGMTVEGSNAMTTLAAQSASAAPLSVRPPAAKAIVDTSEELSSELKVADANLDEFVEAMEVKLNERSCPTVTSEQFYKLHDALIAIKNGVGQARSNADDLRGKLEGGLQTELEQLLELVRRENTERRTTDGDDEAPPAQLTQGRRPRRVSIKP